MTTAFGPALTEAMTAAGTDVQSLAAATGIPDKTLYAYRSGSRNPPGQVKIDAILTALQADGATRTRLYAAAGIAAPADMATLAADLVRGLSTEGDRHLAVELLKTLARLNKPRRKTSAPAATEADVEQVDVDRPEDYALAGPAERRGTPLQVQIDAAEPDPNADRIPGDDEEPA